MVRHAFLIRTTMGSNPIIPNTYHLKTLLYISTIYCNGEMVYTLGLGSNS